MHTVWLEGNTGGERVNVSIWEYNDREQAIYRAELPVVLTGEPQQYAVKTTITDPAVTHIRVLVRTSVQEKVSLYGDLATLRRVTAPVGARARRASQRITPTARSFPRRSAETRRSSATTRPTTPCRGRTFSRTEASRSASPLGGVQNATLTQVDGFGPALGSSSALLTTKGATSDEGFYLGSGSRRAGADLELLGLARGEPRRRGDARGHVAL